MFDDDKIGHQSTYEHFHRTRQAPEGATFPTASEPLEKKNSRQNSWRLRKDRFEHLFERSDRLW